MNKLLTYFTPTYNREKLLSGLYNNLLKQTNKEFVWLIIDDGSKDNTKTLVESWINENKLDIKYHYKENGGKHTAMDLAHQLCETKYICDIDSDDYLDENSTQVILDNIVKIMITDNGEGMTEEELSNIKEMFYTTKKSGTGLGVALSNEIILAHNGNLTYESSKNNGTTCIVSLPM